MGHRNGRDPDHGRNWGKYLLGEGIIKSRLTCSLRGSVNKGNAVDISEVSGVDGVLVGGASLKVEEFAIIIKAFDQNI